MGIHSFFLIMIFFTVCVFPRWAQGASVDFSKVNLNTFVKVACSPQVTESFGDGLYVRTPCQIHWGEPLPVCGYIKVGEKMKSRNVEARIYVDLKKSQRSGDHFMGGLFGANSKKPLDAENTLPVSGELYFNVDGISNLPSALPPGEYEISFDAFAGIYKTAKTSFTIVASGWRKLYSEKFAQAICKDHLAEDLKTYFGKLHGLRIKRPRTAEIGKLWIKNLAAAWQEGISKHVSLMSVDDLRKIRSLHERDQTIPHYVHELVEKTCPTQNLQQRQVDDIFEAIRKYSLPE